MGYSAVVRALPVLHLDEGRGDVTDRRFGESPALHRDERDLSV
jgi:hypothetical protein